MSKLIKRLYEESQDDPSSLYWRAANHIEELEGLVNDIIVDVTEAIETGRSVEDALCWVVLFVENSQRQMGEEE